MVSFYTFTGTSLIADRTSSYSHSWHQSQDKSLSLCVPFPRSNLDTIAEGSTNNYQVVVIEQASEVQNHTILSPTSNASGPESAVFYCCNCGYGPQLVKINVSCCNCGVRYCSRCITSATKRIRTCITSFALYSMEHIWNRRLESGMDSAHATG